MANRYSLKAKITRPKGNCFDIEFLEDIPEYGIKKGEQIPNVPQLMFRKDLEINKNIDLEPASAGKNFMTKYAPYIDQEKCAAARLGMGKIPDTIKEEPDDDACITYQRYTISRTLSFNGEHDDLPEDRQSSKATLSKDEKKEWKHKIYARWG